MIKRKHIYILVRKFGNFEYNTLEATQDARLYSYDIYGTFIKIKEVTGNLWRIKK